MVVATDGERLRTALVNILANARQAVVARDAAADPKAARGNGGPPTSPCDSSGPARAASASRSGTVAPASARRTWHRSSSPISRRRRTGTGLGLPIARNIIEGLGGTLVVRTAVDGTTIDIELPEQALGASAS